MMDYGWDTSEDEGGMEIDLDAKQEESRSGNFEGTFVRGSKQLSVTEDYDPSEPTDDYDPSEPTKDSDSEAAGRNQQTLKGDKNVHSVVGKGGEMLQYDPANPTLSDEDDDSCRSLEQALGNSACSKDEADVHNNVTSPQDKNTHTSLKGNKCTASVSHAGIGQDDADMTGSEEENDGRWDSQVTMTQEATPSPGADSHHLVKKKSFGHSVDDCIAKGEEAEEGQASPRGKGPQEESSSRINRSPSVGLVDSDDNSFMDDLHSVPHVTIDESDFVLEKEPLETADSMGSPWSKNDRAVSREDTMETEHLQHSQKGARSPDSGRHFNLGNEELEGRGRLRRQEDVDTRNEEALVDLFREDSDAERIEDELDLPVKKTKKKVGPKKLKKKGKKVKKSQGKKNAARQQQDDDAEIEDQRFVEIRRDRQSVESREEGELDGDSGNVGHRKSYEERARMDGYQAMFDIANQHDVEQREPGEIVEEGKKKGKKRERKERKKKKSRREVATIEEGNQDDDSQKFPSFLAGFFVQDEGDEDLDDNMENLARSFENDDDRTFQKGGKTYRKRHSSGAEDSVKSFDQTVDRSVSQEMRPEESDHRNRRKHEERRNESRERRHHDIRDTREVRRDKEHRHGTPREKERERERDRERSRGERERERIREREKERERERERDREVTREREKDKARRVEVEERRRRRSRSGSRERRRRSASAERVRRSRSRERQARHRRHRSKSRERSAERDRERERERSKRRHRDRSRDRESERRVRRPSHSRSRSPHRRSERASSNKENRDESHRRRRHTRTHEDSESEDRESNHRRHRRERRERSSSSSSSSSSTDNSSRHREESSRRHHHHHSLNSHGSSDEGASSDVILVEPERIVINLDEEEDPPSRIDITHANTEDDSTTVIDGESIPPPPELSGNSRGSALIQINPAEPDVEDVNGQSEQEGDATPTRDEQTDRVEQGQQSEKSVPESDYDPAHPTEEAEEQEARTFISFTASAPAVLPAEAGPVPPDHPPPEEVRPSPPPGPALIEANAVVHPSQPPPLPQLPLINSQFQQQPPPPAPQQSPQQQQGLLPFPGGPPAGPGQAQRFPPWPLANGPGGNIMPPNSGPPPGFAPNQRGLLPTPDTRPLFSVDSVRMPSPFASLPPLSRPPPPREPMGQQMNIRPPLPISAMAPLAQLTSLLPALERAKMAAHRNEVGMSQQSQVFKHPLAMPSLQSPSLMGKGPLLSSSAPNMSSGSSRPSRVRGGGGELSESTEVVDMDMSPGEDDCELELPSPDSSDSDRDDRKRRGRKSESRTNRSNNDKSASDKGVIQPAVYLKALSKVIEKLTPKGQPQTSGSTVASQDKSRVQSAKKKRIELNDDDVPASAVDLTNKEKYLKKLHLQERVIDEVKLAIKPFYSSKKITKEQYKLILRKAVPKVCHSKSGNINPQKIQQLIEAYVNKMRKVHHASGAKKKKPHPVKETQPATKDSTPAPVKQNGERAKKQPTR